MTNKRKRLRKSLKIQQLLSKGYEILKLQQIESYILDCQLILSKVLNLDRMSIIINRDMEVEDKTAEEYFDLIDKRKNRMPLKYITQSCEFMGIDFFVEEGVLIPRPDTEILVEQVLKEIEDKKFTAICDVCCGSGAIGLSIAKLMDFVKLDCCDIDNKALEVTHINHKRLLLENRVNVIKSDLLQYAIEQGKNFDVIVSNPPYIKTKDIPSLMEDVKDYEPYIALWGGDDGLDFYRNITNQSLKVLKQRGLLAFEIGYDEGEEVSKILYDNGYTDVRCIKDLAGIDRVVLGIKG